MLFEQERIGKFGARFKCLKFRTMHLNCDSKIHEEYVQQFIAGKPESSRATFEPGRTERLQDHERSARDASVAFSARPVSTNCRSYGTCCAARCLWWARGRRFLTNSKFTMFGTGAESSKSNPG